jgi:hypothetical protein
MRRVVGRGLLVLDCLVVAFWLIGFALMATGNLHGFFREAHTVTVLATAVAQIAWGFKCPLMVWRNRLHGEESGDILNPFLILFGQKVLRVSWSSANAILSTIIILGALYYIIEYFL